MRFDAVEVLPLRLSFGNIKKESVADFVELQLLSFLIDLLVMEFELFVLEIIQDWHLSAEINWSLLLAEVTWLRTIEGLFHLLLDFWFDDEIDSRSLANVIFVIFGVVILEAMRVVFLTAWTAFSYVPSLLRTIHTDDLPVLIVVFVCILLKIDVLDGKLARLLDLLFGPLDFTSVENRLILHMFGWGGVAFSFEVTGVTGICSVVLTRSRIH